MHVYHLAIFQKCIKKSNLKSPTIIYFFIFHHQRKIKLQSIAIIVTFFYNAQHVQLLSLLLLQLHFNLTWQDFFSGDWEACSIALSSAIVLSPLSGADISTTMEPLRTNGLMVVKDVFTKDDIDGVVLFCANADLRALLGRALWEDTTLI